MAGKFIVIEGLDGVGKTSVVEELRKLYAGDERVIFTRAPGATELGKSIRELVLYGGKPCPKATLMLFIADFCQTMEEVILPNYKLGITIVSDRWWHSAYAYQLAQGATNNGLWLHNLLRDYVGIAPDLLVYLTREGAKRNGTDNMEQYDDETYERISQNYSFLCSNASECLRLENTIIDDTVLSIAGAINDYQQYSESLLRKQRELSIATGSG